MSRRALLAGLGALLIALSTAACAAGVSRHHRHHHRIALGAYVPEAGLRPGRIDRYARLMGRRPLIVSSYRQWDQAPFVGRELRAVWRRGSVPMVTWEPMSYHGRSYPLRAIARGRYDGYVRRAARRAAEWGRPILVRFAHEMNGNWYPWGAGIEGNDGRRYRRAWRRVVRIFRRAGADNVEWVWTPYIDGGRRPFRAYFPGDRWVDWVGLDGFNWGYGGRYLSFGGVFRSSYRRLARISRRPMMIAETGAYDHGKPRWIRHALARDLPRMHRIRALVWFNHPANGIDLRFNSSRRSLDAFRRAAGERYYRTSREALLAGPSRTRRR